MKNIGIIAILFLSLSLGASGTLFAADLDKKKATTNTIDEKQMTNVSSKKKVTVTPKAVIHNPEGNPVDQGTVTPDKPKGPLDDFADETMQRLRQESFNRCLLITPKDKPNRREYCQCVSELRTEGCDQYR